MDGEVGAHLAALEAAGLADDTIVFYYSDNGGVLPRSKRYCYDAGTAHVADHARASEMVASCSGSERARASTRPSA